MSDELSPDRLVRILDGIETIEQSLGVLSEDLSDEMAAAARFRNVLAHTYGNAIDHDVVYDALNDLERYRDFVVAVRDYLQSIDALG